MKKILFFVLTLLISMSSVFAAPVSKIVFLGDSLTDNGNLYSILLKIIPKSPPYYQGRFSNGPTWAEIVGKYYYDKYYIGYKIYAQGGATALYHAPSTTFVAPTNLTLELNQYLLDDAFVSKTNILYAIWIGSNDYLFDNKTSLDTATTQVVDKIGWATEKLIKHGAHNFLFLNLPDLSRTPFARMNGTVERLHQISMMHNQKLADMIQQLRNKHPDVRIVFFNLSDLFADVLDNPEKYNQKYQIHLKDTTQSCWDGGFFIREMSIKTMLYTDLQHAMNDEGRSTVQDKEINGMVNDVMNMPFAEHLYAMGKAYDAGVVPCSNADEHIFWDDMHPTEVVHRVLGRLVIESLESQLQQ